MSDVFMSHYCILFQALVLEYWSSKHRVIVACIKDFMWPMGLLALSVLAYFIRDRASLHLTVAAICSLAFLSWFTTPESLR